jgi:dihydrolipoamide dehydrogenase
MRHQPKASVSWSTSREIRRTVCEWNASPLHVSHTEEQARAIAERERFELGKALGHFRANSKALAENHAEGIAKVLFRKDTGELLGMHIIGMHAADLIHEAANAMQTGIPVHKLAFAVHTHPTLSEICDEAFKAAAGMAAH